MNIFSLSKKACVVASLAIACAANAQTFSYNNGNLLVGFRLTAGGVNDLVINAGSASTFTNMAAGTTINVANFTPSMLQTAFGDTNNLSFSAFGCFDASYPDSAQQKTLFMTRARTDINTQSSPWPRYIASAQGVTVSTLNAAGFGAQAIALDLPASATTNQAGFLIESESWSASPKVSYKTALGASFNWGSFGITEQSTSPTFTTDGTPVRADLYWIVPGGNIVTHPASTYLGYFQLNTNGVLTYTSGAATAVVTAASITGITRVGNVATVSFTTGSVGTYTLRATSDITTPKASWTTLGSVSGNGSVQSLTETTTASPRFYMISAQ